MAKSSLPTKSRRSGGPQTPEGKKASSRNSLKTGAYSATVILPGEDESALQKLEAQFVRDFDPRDIAEGAMVRELAIVTWKKLRLERLEQSSFLRAMNAPLRKHEFTDYGIHFSDETFALFAYGLVVSESEAAALQKKLALALPFTQQNWTAERYRDLKHRCPDLYEQVIKEGRECGCFGEQDPSLDQLVLSYIELERGGEQSLGNFVLEPLIEDMRARLWYAKNQDAMRDAVARIKEARLLDLMQVDKTRRVHDDLSRAFYRALAELRRHQEWRRRLLIVDIPPQAEDSGN